MSTPTNTPRLTHSGSSGLKVSAPPEQLDGASGQRGGSSWLLCYEQLRDKILTPEEASCLPSEPVVPDPVQDFLQRRIDARNAPPIDDRQLDLDQVIREARQSDTLDRAMSKAGPHDTALAERLSPWRYQA